MQACLLHMNFSRLSVPQAVRACTDFASLGYAGAAGRLVDALMRKLAAAVEPPGHRHHHRHQQDQQQDQQQQHSAHGLQFLSAELQAQLYSALLLLGATNSSPPSGLFLGNQKRPDHQRGDVVGRDDPHPIAIRGVLHKLREALRSCVVVAGGGPGSDQHQQHSRATTTVSLSLSSSVNLLFATLAAPPPPSPVGRGRSLFPVTLAASTEEEMELQSGARTAADLVRSSPDSEAAGARRLRGGAEDVAQQHPIEVADLVHRILREARMLTPQERHLLWLCERALSELPWNQGHSGSAKRLREGLLQLLRQSQRRSVETAAVKEEETEKEEQEEVSSENSSEQEAEMLMNMIPPIHQEERAGGSGGVADHRRSWEEHAALADQQGEDGDVDGVTPPEGTLSDSATLGLGLTGPAANASARAALREIAALLDRSGWEGRVSLVLGDEEAKRRTLSSSSNHHDRRGIHAENVGDGGVGPQERQKEDESFLGIKEKRLAVSKEDFLLAEKSLSPPLDSCADHGGGQVPQAVTDSGTVDDAGDDGTFPGALGSSSLKEEETGFDQEAEAGHHPWFSPVAVPHLRVWPQPSRQQQGGLFPQLPSVILCFGAPSHFLTTSSVPGGGCTDEEEIRMSPEEYDLSPAARLHFAALKSASSACGGLDADRDGEEGRSRACSSRRLKPEVCVVPFFRWESLKISGDENAKLAFLRQTIARAARGG